MASVNGSRTVKFVPCPVTDEMRSEPPSFLTSLATTSIPTPRPADCVTTDAVVKPGDRISCMISSSVTLLSGFNMSSS